MSNLQKYTPFTAEDAASERSELEKLGDSAFLKMKNGKNVLRFLPGRPGQKWATRIQQHFVKLSEEKTVSFACPRMMAKKACPACEWADKLRASGTTADFAAAKGYQTKMRAFANVVDRGNPEAGVQVIGMGKGVYDDLCALAEDTTLGGDFTRPDALGYDIVIEKSGKGLDTEYKVFPARAQSGIGEESWLESMHDLSKHAVILPYEEIVKLMTGQGGGRKQAGGEGSAVEPRAPKRRTAADDAMGD